MKKALLILTALFLVSGVALAQRTISGTVTNDKNEPMIGATVVAKGTNVGTVTDLDGKYTLTVPTGATTLVFSFTGSTPRELQIGASNAVDASLNEGTVLDEFVTVAFGPKKDKKTLGYGVTQINSDELTTARTTDVTNALAGKVAGIRLSGSGGSFTTSSIIIRGFTTFTGNNQPLYVIDGIPIDNSGGGSPLQNGPSVSGRSIDINQEDIESISVLKGGAATALYGSRGASGAILITTKKGKVGQKNTVSYSVSYAFQDVDRLPDYQNKYGQGFNGVYNNADARSWGPAIAGQKVPNWYKNNSTLPNQPDSISLNAYPNNVSNLFRTGTNMQHNLSFSGSDGKTTYRFAYGYLQDLSVLDNNKLDRHNLTINLGTQVTNNLSFSGSMTYTNTASKRTQQGNQLSNPLFRGWFTPRSYDLTGLPYQDQFGNQLYFGGEDNPYWSIQNNRYNDQNDRINGYASLRYTFTDWLSAEYKIGLDNYTLTRHGYDQIGARGGANTSAGGIGGIRERRDISRILSSYFTLSAQKKLSRDFNLTGLLGNEVGDNYANSESTIGKGVIIRDLENLNTNTTTYFPTYATAQTRLIGLFANATLSYKNFATLDGSIRNDWSSTFRPGNNSYVYYSGAGTLNLVEATNMKSDYINEFKLRASYGKVGKAAPVYLTDVYYAQAGSADGFGPSIVFPYNGQPGYGLNTAAGNPALGPEFTTTIEGGVDLGLFKNRITLELTRYKNHSTNIILAVPTSNGSGLSNLELNAGSLTTNGWEFSLGITPIKTRDFNWTTRFNYTQFKSIVDELASNVQNIFLGGFTTPNIRLVAGDEYGQIYGNAYARDASGNMILTAAGLPTATANVQKIGNPNPKYTVGISNDFSFKGVHLSVLFDIRHGGDIYSRNLADLRRNGVAAETAEFPRLNSDGTQTTPYTFAGVLPGGKINSASDPNAVHVTAQNYWGNTGKYVAAEGYIVDASWVRVREASLGYAIPTSWLGRSGLKGLEFSIYGRNLFLYTPFYKHLDPEQNALGISNAQGLEFNALPQTRSAGANLKVTF